jgi:hypothetical protein
MKLACIFSTNLAHFILSNMIVPQLEKGTYGAEVQAITL